MRNETARETNKSLVTKLQLAFTVETVSCTPVIFTFLFRCKRSGNLSELRKGEREIQNCKPEVASNVNGFETRQMLALSALALFQHQPSSRFVIAECVCSGERE